MEGRKMFLGKLAFTFGAFALFASSMGFSSTEIQMVQVASSYPSGYTGKIVASIDDSGVGLNSFHFSDSRNTNLEFTVAQLRTGVVLVHALGKDILKISGPQFASDGGGQMILTFLKSFLGGDRREVRFDYIRRGGATEWVLQTDDSEGRDPFDSLSIEISKTIGIPTGVGDITLSDSDRMIRHYDPSHLPPGLLDLDDPSFLFAY